MSDQLRLLPPEVLAQAYARNQQLITQALAPLDQTVVIGPPSAIPRNEVKAEEIKIVINDKTISLKK